MRVQAIVALQLLVLAVRAQLVSPCYSPSPSPSHAPHGHKWYATRYFFFSDKAPMNKVLRNVHGFVQNADTALDMLENVERSILDQLSRSSRRPAPTRRSRSRMRKLCNLQDTQWRYAAIDQVELRFDVNATIDCVTDFIADQEDQNEMHRIVFNFNKMMEENAVHMAREAGTNFTDADTIFNYAHDTPTQTCYVNALGAYRVNSTWHLNIGITNEKKEKHLAEFKRHYLVETMTRGGGFGRMRLPVRPADGEEETERRFMWNTSTIMVSHRFTAEPAFFKAVFLEENVAVVRSTNEMELLMQQVNDAVTYSSICILLLPLWLNCVPIALLADVSSASMLMYAFLSDVLTALPLAIKGAELMWIGSRGTVGTVVRMSSGLGGVRSTTAASEVYVCKCFAKWNVWAVGTAFLVTALVFMVGGIGAEFAAKRHKARLRKRAFRGLGVSEWKSSTTGAGSECGGGDLVGWGSCGAQRKGA